MSYQSPKVTMYDISGNPITNIGADNTTNSTSKLPVLPARANTSAPTWTDGYMVPLSVDTSGALRISGTITSSGASVSATGSAPPSSATFMGGSVTTAAPSYTNGTMNALSLTTTGLLRIDGSSVTQPISAASLPLPTGAATETTLGGVLTTTAFQARINTLGQKTMANSTPVVLSSDQTVIPVSDNGGSITVDGTVSISGTVTTQDTTSLVDNAAFTDGTSRVLAAGFIFDEVAGTALTENDVAAARLDSKRAQIGVLEDGTTRGTRNTIKAASTAAVATDTALVVAISPNNTIVTSNAAVSATGASPPASATYIGGSVTTAAPSYTNATMNALSLTTTGLLRIDGSGVTQPISAASLPLPTGAATEASLAKLTITQGTALGANTQALVGGSVTTAAPAYTTGQISPLSLTTTGLLRIDGSGVTQPVSGTVTANIGTSGSLALDASITAQTLVDNATFTDGTTRVNTAGYIFDEVAGTALTENDAAAARIDSKRAQINVLEDGTTRGTRNTIKAASTAAVATDTALVVAISPNNTIVTSNAAVSATGAAPPASATYIGGSVTTAAPTYTTGQMNALSLTTAGALRIDGSGVTQPVSGTVTANIGTTNGLALDATLSAMSLVDNAVFTDGTTRVQPVGFIFDEVAGTALTENDTGAARMDSKRAIINVIEDGTTRGTRVAVKAASTAPVAADPALVVAISPNTPFASDTTLLAQTIVDNAAFTDGTTRVQPVGFIFDEVAGTALTENDGAAARIDSKRAMIMTIEDGTTRGTRVAVKAASTAAVAADPALVVTLSPNYSADTVVTGTLTALNQTVSLVTAGKYTVGANLTGTWVGTIVSEGSVDGGVTWFAIRTSNKSTNDIVFNYTANDNFEFYSHGGCTNVRLRMSAYTSGTANVAMAGTSTAQDSLLNYSGTDGDAAPPLRHLSMLQFDGAGTPRLAKCANNTPVGTEYSSIVRAISCSGSTATYAATITGLATAATPTDIFTLTGSASTTVRINRISLSGTQTTATQRDILLIKRSTANSAGTSTSPTVIPYDSTNAAATAIARAYTANPTLGTTVGTLYTEKVFIATTTTDSDQLVLEFGTRSNQPIFLRGTAEVLAINLNSISSAGSSINITIEWTEE